MVRFYFYNTDRQALSEHPIPRFSVLIKNGFAALGGDYGRFGSQFAQLSKSDKLLMYENGTGVVAVGSVLENWNGKQYEMPRYYKKRELANLTDAPFEYRIAVDWHTDLSDRPITLGHLRDALGSPSFTPRGAVRPIIKQHAIVGKMLREIEFLKQGPVSAVDDDPPSRTIFAVSRIVRDTAKSRSVKELHCFECQVCGDTIELPGGERYAEAHHLRPLGHPHDGPDSIENLICVCPNHHVMLDYGAIRLDSALLRCVDGHSIASKFIDYHNHQVVKGTSE